MIQRASVRERSGARWTGKVPGEAGGSYLGGGTLSPASCAWCHRRLPLAPGSHGICPSCKPVDAELSARVRELIFGTVQTVGIVAAFVVFGVAWRAML